MQRNQYGAYARLISTKLSVAQNVVLHNATRSRTARNCDRVEDEYSLDCHVKDSERLTKDVDRFHRVRDDPVGATSGVSDNDEKTLSERNPAGKQHQILDAARRLTRTCVTASTATSDDKTNYENSGDQCAIEHLVPDVDDVEEIVVIVHVRVYSKQRQQTVDNVDEDCRDDQRQGASQTHPHTAVGM